MNGFLNYVANGNGYVECAGRRQHADAQPDHGRVPGGRAHHRTGGRSTSSRPASRGLTVEEAGTQTIIQHELALFLQDSWKPRPT